jgi:hypothetical protein
MIALLVFGATSMGCRSRAYQQVYNDKMAAEIRQLEDQVYETEYENEVLKGKLARLEQRSDAGDRPSRLDAGDRNPPRSGAEDRPSGDQPNDRRRRGDELPFSDLLPRSDDDLPLDPMTDRPLDIDLGTPSDGGTMTPPSLDTGTSPPIKPIPPRESDLTPPAIDLGDPQPPGGNNGTQPRPPGQIRIPGDARRLYPGAPPVAAAVKIHPGLTGVNRTEATPDDDGLLLVLSVEDTDGKAFQAEYPISVVVLDPAQKGEQARLGRWDLTAEEAIAAFRDSPVAGYQIPLAWKDRLPAGNEVAVFVRVVVDQQTYLEDSLVLPLDKNAATASRWVPSGLGSPVLPIGITGDSIWR